MRRLMVLVAISACGKSSPDQPPAPPPAIEVPETPETRRLADEILASTYDAVIVGYYNKIPAESASRKRVEARYQQARRAVLEDRGKSIDSAVTSHYCVGAHKVASMMAGLFLDEDDRFLDKAKNCRSARTETVPASYASATWEPADAPGDAVYFDERGELIPGRMQDNETIFDVYARTLLDDPATALEIVGEPPTGRPIGDLERDAAKQVQAQLVKRGVPIERLFLDTRATTYTLSNTTVALLLQVSR